jgi:hypothetical protein
VRAQGPQGAVQEGQGRPPQELYRWLVALGLQILLLLLLPLPLLPLPLLPLLLPLAWRHTEGGAFASAKAGVATGTCCALRAAAGIDDPYEEPEAAEVVLEAFDGEGKQISPMTQAAKLLEFLERQGYLAHPPLLPSNQRLDTMCP